jgi:hypothetical protein
MVEVLWWIHLDACDKRSSMVLEIGSAQRVFDFWETRDNSSSDIAKKRHMFESFNMNVMAVKHTLGYIAEDVRILRDRPRDT